MFENVTAKIPFSGGLHSGASAQSFSFGSSVDQLGSGISPTASGTCQKCFTSHLNSADDSECTHLASSGTILKITQTMRSFG